MSYLFQCPTGQLGDANEWVWAEGTSVNFGACGFPDWRTGRARRAERCQQCRVPRRQGHKIRHLWVSGDYPGGDVSSKSPVLFLECLHRSWSGLQDLPDYPYRHQYHCIHDLRSKIYFRGPWPFPTLYTMTQCRLIYRLTRNFRYRDRPSRCRCSGRKERATGLSYN